MWVQFRRRLRSHPILLACSIVQLVCSGCAHTPLPIQSENDRDLTVIKSVIHHQLTGSSPSICVFSRSFPLNRYALWQEYIGYPTDISWTYRTRRPTSEFRDEIGGYLKRDIRPSLETLSFSPANISTSEMSARPGTVEECEATDQVYFISRPIVIDGKAFIRKTVSSACSDRDGTYLMTVASPLWKWRSMGPEISRTTKQGPCRLGDTLSLPTFLQRDQAFLIVERTADFKNR